MIYLKLFFTYVKIGLFTIGGGYAMIPLMQQEVVTHQGWLTMAELTDFIAVAESTPGPFAINTATFIGMKVAGLPGAMLTTFGVVLPSFIIILLIAKFFSNFQDNKWVKGSLYGMSSVVVGLIASAVCTLAMGNFLIAGSFYGRGLELKGILIFGICCAIYFKGKINPILLIILAAGLGMLLYGVLPMLVV